MGQNTGISTHSTNVGAGGRAGGQGEATVSTAGPNLPFVLPVI